MGSSSLHYEHSTYGYSYSLSHICATIGLGQIEVLDDRVARRREIFARYEAALTRPGIAFMPEPEGQTCTRSKRAAAAKTSA